MSPCNSILREVLFASQILCYVICVTTAETYTRFLDNEEQSKYKCAASSPDDIHRLIKRMNEQVALAITNCVQYGGIQHKSCAHIYQPEVCSRPPEGYSCFFL